MPIQDIMGLQVWHALSLLLDILLCPPEGIEFGPETT